MSRDGDALEEKKQEDDELRLKIDAHVVRQLGAELISGPEIALLELVKNSFDADADYCQVSIETGYEEVVNGFNYKGKISVSDNGHGMSRSIINQSWLTISHSEKRLAKSLGQKTNKHERNYTGDKGLGRLGSMQLGQLCRINTHNSDGGKGLQVYFDWSHFKQGCTLDSVAIYEVELEPKKKSGTEIEVLGLSDIEYWREEKNLTKLKYKLSSMVSPFGHLKNFQVFLNIEGIEHELEVVDEKVNSLCASQFDFKVQGGKVITEGVLKLTNFTPADSNDKSHFEKFAMADSGKKLFEYLIKDKALSEYKQNEADGSYFIKFYREIEINDISGTSKRLKKNVVNMGEKKDDLLSNFTHPGDFDGKIYQFVFKKDNLQLEELTFNETKTLVQELTGGVAAYRDGFRIGSKRSDWLGLADDMTSGSGSYSLRPMNTAGYINLTWENNPGLQEKSDRESFIENEAFYSFYILCQEIIGSINKYLNYSRRASLKFIRHCNEKEADKPESYSGKHAIIELDSLTRGAESVRKNVQKRNNSAHVFFNESKAYLDKAIVENEQSLFHDPALTAQIEKIKNKTEELEAQFNEYALGYEEFTTKLGQHIISVEKLKFEIESYEEQIKAFYDHVAIGLSAQALAHEANSQVNNIYIHLNAALSRLKELGIKDQLLTKNLLSIRGDTQVLSKSISSLDPLVRAHRSVLETFNVGDEIEHYLDLRVNYFRDKGIEILFNAEGPQRSIKFNRGKFFQVVDNIVRNSEHWLEVYATHYPKNELEIHIELTNNLLTIWDTGKGVRPALEGMLFDMFASDKKDGQGLGLFIVDTLLRERGCSITLLEERNEFGRRYKFAINLIEAMD
ncbi:ATP-binding protein [Pseudoalteromonas piscicida]|uniref:ATP-binding protein n=1 Tax=Pseudoalteromonas piscicida TaxID=43662 RepID=UPI001EFD006F|nr:sensor histidine kinase [Pseudoalteromonas piscicida]MCG9770139.1 ATP-binding protein [Pseudoalteromonas piscicida]